MQSNPPEAIEFSRDIRRIATRMILRIHEKIDPQRQETRERVRKCLNKLSRTKKQKVRTLLNCTPIFYEEKEEAEYKIHLEPDFEFLQETEEFAELKKDPTHFIEEKLPIIDRGKETMKSLPKGKKIRELIKNPYDRGKVRILTCDRKKIVIKRVKKNGRPDLEEYEIAGKAHAAGIPTPRRVGYIQDKGNTYILFEYMEDAKDLNQFSFSKAEEYKRINDIRYTSEDFRPIIDKFHEKLLEDLKNAKRELDNGYRLKFFFIHLTKALKYLMKKINIKFSQKENVIKDIEDQILIFRGLENLLYDKEEITDKRFKELSKKYCPLMYFFSDIMLNIRETSILDEDSFIQQKLGISASDVEKLKKVFITYASNSTEVTESMAFLIDLHFKKLETADGNSNLKLSSIIKKIEKIMNKAKQRLQENRNRYISYIETQEFGASFLAPLEKFRQKMEKRCKKLSIKHKDLESRNILVKVDENGNLVPDRNGNAQFYIIDWEQS